MMTQTYSLNWTILQCDGRILPIRPGKNITMTVDSSIMMNMVNISVKYMGQLYIGIVPLVIGSIRVRMGEVAIAGMIRTIMLLV